MGNNGSTSSAHLAADGAANNAENCRTYPVDVTFHPNQKDDTTLVADQTLPFRITQRSRAK